MNIVIFLQVSISDSALMAIVQYAKEVGVIAQNSGEDKEFAELLNSVETSVIILVSTNF